ncbi:MAG: phospholipid carrier-dependent glycosyltransferase, partial [Verrucomicrobiaceae bacterium]
MLSRHQPLLLFLCIFGLGLGLFTRHNDFPCYYHPDEFGKAKQLVKGTRNFHHPMLMLTTADWTRKLALDKEGRRDYQAVTVTGRWVTAGFAALGAAALALLAARQHHLLAGWLVGVLTVSNSLIFELAHYFKEDPYLTCGIALTALALHVFQRKPDMKRLCLLAAATSLAASGKFIGIALLPMVLVAVWFITGPADPRRRKAGLGYFLLVFALVWAAFNYQVFKPDSKMWGSIGEEMDKAYGNEILNRRNSFGFYFNVQDQNGGWLPPILTGLWLLWA